jgi:hypothetical protein
VGDRERFGQHDEVGLRRAASAIIGLNCWQLSIAVLLPRHVMNRCKPNLRDGGGAVSLKETSLHSTLARGAQRRCNSTIAFAALDGAR